MDLYSFSAIVKVSILFFILGLLVGLIVMFFFARNNPKIIQQVHARLKVEFDDREKALRSETDKLKEQLARYEIRAAIKEVLADMGIKKE